MPSSALPLWSVYEITDTNFNPNLTSNNMFVGKWTKISKTKWIRNDGQPIPSDLLNSAQEYAVGSYYISNVNTPPSTALGFGTWVQVTNGRHLMATTGSAGDGGSGSLNIAIANMPNHGHDFRISNSGLYIDTASPICKNRGDAINQSLPIYSLTQTPITTPRSDGWQDAEMTLLHSGSGTALANSPLNKSAFIWYRTA